MKTNRKLIFAAFAVALACAQPAFAEDMDHAGQPQGGGMMGHEGMGMGRHGNGMNCHCPMMEETQGDLMPEGMKKPETAEMSHLRTEMEAQMQKMKADRAQMKADCEKMMELHKSMKDLMHRQRHHHHHPSKGNAAPVNPAVGE